MAGRIAFGGTNDQIEQITQQLRQSVLSKMGKTDVSTEVMLTWIVDKLGGEINVASDATNIEGDGGSLVVYEKGRFVIWLSPYTSPLRDNFTIAHELGHYFLHYDHKSESKTTAVFNRYGSDQGERQANRFAAALLMPQPEFKEALEKFKGNTQRVAGHFQVSEPAARVRAEALHLI